jgi:hypothetical protein
MNTEYVYYNVLDDEIVVYHFPYWKQISSEILTKYKGILVYHVVYVGVL